MVRYGGMLGCVTAVRYGSLRCVTVRYGALRSRVTAVRYGSLRYVTVRYDALRCVTLTRYGDALQCVTAVRYGACLLYTSPSPRDRQKSRMPSSA